MEIDQLPLVSIITPVYNGSQYLEELIQSVLDQEYINVEHIIIDDGSEDHGATLSVLDKYSHLRWLSRENKGQYATMNDGLQLARGKYVCFISADDVIAPRAVKLAVDFLLQDASFEGVFGVTKYIDQDGKDLPFLIPFKGANLRFHPYFAHIAHCSLYVKKETLQKNNLFFDASLKYTGDYDWIVRMHLKQIKIGFIKQEFSKVRLHQDQTSQIYKSESFDEFDFVRKRNHVNAQAYAFLSGINIWIIRLWKAVRLLKDKGFFGVTKFLFNFLYKRHA